MRLFFRFLLVTVFLVLAACSSKYEEAQKHFANGKEYFDSREYEYARVEFLNAIQRDPSFADAYFHLGLIAQQQGQIEIVYEMMMKAAKLDATNTRASLTLAELMLLARQFDLAEEYAVKLIEQETHLFEANRIIAAANIGRSAFGQAEIFLKKAEALKPNDASLFGLRAIVARDRGDAKSALKNLTLAIEQGVDKEHYLLLRSKIYSDQGNYLKLNEDLRALISLAPEREAYVFSLAKLLAQKGQYAESEKVLQALMKLQPKNYRAMQIWLDVIYLQDQARGDESLASLLQQHDRASVLQFYKVRSLLKQGELETAKTLLSEIIQSSKETNDVLKSRALLAEVLLSQDEKQKAERLIEKNLSVDDAHEESLLVSADHDIRISAFESAIPKLHRVLRKNPNSEKALVLLGQAYIKSGSDLLADDAFRQVLQLNPSNQFAAIPVAKNLIRSEDLERSESVIERVLSKSPDDPKLLMFYVRVLLLKEDWALAHRVIERLSKLPNANVYAEFLSGKLAEAQQAWQFAIEHYRNALELNPALLPALKGLSRCYTSLGDEASLIKYLQAYKQKHSDVVEAYALAAKSYVKVGNFHKATEELEVALRLQPLWEGGYIQLAGIHNILGDQKAAEETYRQGILALPDSAYLKTLLASFFEASDRKAEALVQYELTLASHPSSLVARNNYVSLLLSGDTSSEQKAKALNLAEAFKSSQEPRFLDTYGYALLKNERAVEAEMVLRKAAEKALHLVEIQEHFALALMAVERFEEARVVLKRSLKHIDPESEKAQQIDALMTRIEKALESQHKL